MKVLCLLDGRDLPGSRFRFYQYQELFRKAGVRLVPAPSWPAKDFSPRQLMPQLYAANRTATRLAALGLFGIMFLKRLFDIVRAFSYDAVIVQRGLYPFGPPLLERLLRAVNPELIFDFDDAIHLRDGRTVAAVIGMSRRVIAGNQVLAEFARRHHPDVHVVPTALDTARYQPRPRERDDGRVVLGYIASVSTLCYLEALYPVLDRLRARYPQLVLRVVSSFAGTGFRPLPGMECRGWTPEGEAEEVGDFDIGVMPLPDNEWSRGKCGFKLLQYMAMGVAAVASPIGINCRIIREGENGLLARDTAEWEDQLARLIEDPRLRARLGREGRKTVEREYSTEAVFPRFLAAVQVFRAPQ